MAKILVVEDNEMSRDVLTRRLARQGHELIAAPDGKTGLALARSANPDLILMDLQVPEIDGWETTRYLKGDAATRHIRIIALSAHALESDREKALQAGCDDFATKPVDFAKLLYKIDSALQERTYSEPASSRPDC